MSDVAAYHVFGCATHTQIHDMLPHRT